MIKAHFSGRMVSSGISDVAFASVYSEKARLKKLMMMNKSQEMTVFSENHHQYYTIELHSGIGH